MMRRAIVVAAVTYTVMSPRRALAHNLPTTKELKIKFQKLNEQDIATIKADTIKSISEWEVIKNDQKLTASLSSVRYDFLLKLHSTSSSFSKPMSIFLKSFARQRMSRMYDCAESDEEKALVMQVIMYYGLLE